jgi:hypothetical protein
LWCDGALGETARAGGLTRDDVFAAYGVRLAAKV